MSEKSVFSKRERRIIEDFARTHIPRGGPYEMGAQDVDIVGKIEVYMAGLHPLISRFMRLGLHWFNLSPLFSFRGFLFIWLDDDKKIRHLKKLSESKYSVKRLNLFIPKFLTNMFFYADPEVEKRIGYFRHCEGEKHLESQRGA